MEAKLRKILELMPEIEHSIKMVISETPRSMSTDKYTSLFKKITKWMEE